MRPISNRPSHEISEEDRRYEDGKRAALLDVITIPLLAHQPNGYQAENYIIDGDKYWVKEGTLDYDDLADAVDSVTGPLWTNVDGSSYNGINDKISPANLATISSSLLLVEPADLTIVVGREGGVFAPVKRTVRADFRLNGLNYRLMVTDPVVEQEFLQKADGSHAIEDGYHVRQSRRSVQRVCI